MSNKIKKPTSPEREVRSFSVELRAAPDGSGRKIEGYAAVFDEDSEDLGFYERIAPGAFDEADMGDVRALFNHDPNYVLARSASGTLSLEIDERGLKYSFDAPDTTFGNALLKMIRSGDISHSSFAFTIAEDAWEERDGREVRTIEKVHTVYDVSPVTYPAYNQTSATARSVEWRNAQLKADQWEREEVKILIEEVTKL